MRTKEEVTKKKNNNDLKDGENDKMEKKQTLT